MSKSTIIHRIMTERVPMLGMPQVIVTRHFRYQWLKAHGWNEGRPNSQQSGYCFQSLDYAAFGRPAVNDPLTEEQERDRLLELMASALEREEQ